MQRRARSVIFPPQCADTVKYTVKWFLLLMTGWLKVRAWWSEQNIMLWRSLRHWSWGISVPNVLSRWTVDLLALLEQWSLCFESCGEWPVSKVYLHALVSAIPHRPGEDLLNCASFDSTNSIQFYLYSTAPFTIVLSHGAPTTKQRLICVYFLWGLALI